MILDWPSDLPPPLQRGRRVQRDDPRAARSGETGPPAWRRRSSAVFRTREMSIEVDRALKARFDRFYDEETGGGVKPFWMPDWATDGWRLLDAEGADLTLPDSTPILLAARDLCLFGAATPSETIRGVVFTITFPVVILP